MTYQMMLDSMSDEEIIAEIECIKAQINNVSEQELLDRGCGTGLAHPRKTLYGLRNEMFKRHWGISKTAATRILLFSGVLYLIFKK